MPQNFDDSGDNAENQENPEGVDPRRLKKPKTATRERKPDMPGKRSWRDKLRAEQEPEVYYENEEEKNEKKKNETPTVAVDHDRNPRAKSRPLPVPKNLVQTDALGAPKTEKPKKSKKFSFAKRVKMIRRGGGNGKKV